jgi:hypothetical protein
MRYLKITYVRRATGQMDEQVEIVRRLRPRDISEGSVILDFRDRCVVKASVGDQIAPRQWQRIRDFYHQHYADIIDQLEAVTWERSPDNR